MAQITLSSRSVPRPYRSRKGDYSIFTFNASTAISTAAIVYGDVVQFDVNTATARDKIVKSSTMANVPNVISTAILGLAVSNNAQAGSSATADPIQVCLADSQTEFLFPSKIAGADYGSSLATLRKAIGYDSTLGIFYMDAANSTAGDATLIVTGIYHDAGTTNGSVIVKFNSTNVSRFLASGL